MVMIRPVQNLTCGLSACHSCYTRLLEVEEQKGNMRAKCSESCTNTYCRRSLTLTINYIINKLTSKVKVKCLNHDCSCQDKLGRPESTAGSAISAPKCPAPWAVEKSYFYESTTFYILRFGIKKGHTGAKNTLVLGS